MPQRHSRHQFGATVIEISIVLAVLAVLVGTAIPSFQQLRLRQQLEGVVAQVAADVMHVRSEAVSRNEPVRISFKAAAGGSCYVVHTGDASNCTCTAPGPAVCSGGARELKTVYWPHSTGVRVSAKAASSLFDPVRGTTTPTNTVYITADNGDEVRQIVNVMGRVRACSPGGVRGYKPC